MTASPMTPTMRPAESHRRSFRAGRRRNEATTVMAQTMTRSVTTRRFPNSMSGWRLSGGVRWCSEQVGQSGQPRPESDRRTAAPVTTFRTIVAVVTRQRRRNGRGPIRREDTVSSSYRPGRAHCLGPRRGDARLGFALLFRQWRFPQSC